MKVFHLLLLTLLLDACQNGERNNPAKKERLDHEARFTSFSIDNYKSVVIKCDLGRMKLTARQYEVPKIEIHKTYQKYVRLEPANDTLFVYINGTPRNTGQVKVQKYINLYLPELRYLESDVSQITIQNYESRDMRIVNHSNGLRLYNCRIQNLSIENTGLNNIHLDGNNYFEQLFVDLNEDTHFNSEAMVLKNFTLKAASMENASFSNIPPDGFHWIKK